MAPFFSFTLTIESALRESLTVLTRSYVTTTVEFVVIERAYQAKYHKNEGSILSKLVNDGSAEVSYADPLGRFNVYNVRQYLEQLKKPASLRDCRIF